ncbi:jg27309 [Pararge aegeria aegeria]|uniref:Jg27309 protein n=1 Tax=Pararge aegeria aegeria TaxID=348720 RepID=A0A8S4QEM3_9NEOP|nr:jg27309 [Pararge aegeria aegeria]
MVLCLSETINVKLESRDIKDIFRLPSRKQETNSNSPIVVELGSTILKSELLKQAKSFNIKNKIKIQAKHLGHTTKEDTPVFLAEHLTPQGARLFFLARDLVKTGKYKYCWTSYGKILVRKDDTSKVIHITNESQIHNLVQSA